MIAKHAGVAMAALFQAIRGASSAAMLSGAANMGAPDADVEQRRLMAMQLESQRHSTAENIAKQQNLDRMRSFTRAQLGIGLAEQGMGHNPMLSGGGGGSSAAPFVAWSAQRG